MDKYKEIERKQLEMSDEDMQLRVDTITNKPKEDKDSISLSEQ